MFALRPSNFRTDFDLPNTCSPSDHLISEQALTCLVLALPRAIQLARILLTLYGLAIAIVILNHNFCGLSLYFLQVIAHMLIRRPALPFSLSGSFKFHRLINQVSVVLNSLVNNRILSIISGNISLMINC